ncbi:hypothetical protein BLOT_000270, partial [Blomia tropicalis]
MMMMKMNMQVDCDEMNESSIIQQMSSQAITSVTFFWSIGPKCNPMTFLDGKNKPHFVFLFDLVGLRATSMRNFGTSIQEQEQKPTFLILHHKPILNNIWAHTQKEIVLDNRTQFKQMFRSLVMPNRKRGISSLSFLCEHPQIYYRY